MMIQEVHFLLWITFRRDSKKKKRDHKTPIRFVIPFRQSAFKRFQTVWPISIKICMINMLSILLPNWNVLCFVQLKGSITYPSEISSPSNGLFLADFAKMFYTTCRISI